MFALNTWNNVENDVEINHDNPDYDSISMYMSQFGSGQILLKKDYWSEGICLLEIKNEEKRNAISGKMMVDLRDCLNELENWTEGKAVILYGSGINFCAGGDLDFARAKHTEYDGFCLSALMMDNLHRFRKLPMVTISMIHGPTIGGGAEIAIQSDFILTCDDVKFGFVHGKMGISTSWGGTTRLVQLLGQRAALNLLLTSTILTATDLQSIGLSFQIINQKEKMNAALDFARERIKLSCDVIRSFKEAILAAGDSDRNYEESLKIERRIFCPLWGGPANKKALDEHIKHIR